MKEKNIETMKKLVNESTKNRTIAGNTILTTGGFCVRTLVASVFFCVIGPQTTSKATYFQILLVVFVFLYGWFQARTRS